MFAKSILTQDCMMKKPKRICGVYSDSMEMESQAEPLCSVYCILHIWENLVGHIVILCIQTVWISILSTQS